MPSVGLMALLAMPEQRQPITALSETVMSHVHQKDTPVLNESI